MKIDIISDMHVEHNTAWADHPSNDGRSSIYPWHVDQEADVLLIVGDCGNDPFTTLAVVEEAASFYKNVIFTDGNHEHYNGPRSVNGIVPTVGRNNELFHRYTDERDNVTFVDGDTWIEIDNTLFIGANGWYDWKAYAFASRDQQHLDWKKSSNDSRMIRFDENGYPDKLAATHAQLLADAVTWAQDDTRIDNIVVMTHTIPHAKGLVSDNHAWGYLNGSYHNTEMKRVWEADTNNKIKLWAFGHTHFHYDFDAEGIRFVNNSRGYASERYNSPFMGLKTVTLGEAYNPFSKDD